jgi:ribosomal-protein-alanine N-acetyltransferase
MEREIGLRQAAPDDVEVIVALQRLVPEAATWTPADYLSLLSGEGTICLLAEDRVRERLVGFLLARTIADEVEILNLAVVPTYRRRGVARRLLGAALAGAQAQEARECWLEVRASNRAALNFYCASGSALHHRRRQYYHDPPEDAVVCVRYLEESIGVMLPCPGVFKREHLYE